MAPCVIVVENAVRRLAEALGAGMRRPALTLGCGVIVLGLAVMVGRTRLTYSVSSRSVSYAVTLSIPVLAPVSNITTEYGGSSAPLAITEVIAGAALGAASGLDAGVPSHPAPKSRSMQARRMKRSAAGIALR